METLITVPKYAKHFPEIKWLASCVSKEGTRFNLQSIHVDETHAFATDGTIAVAWEHSGVIQAGQWKIVVNTAKEVILNRIPEVDVLKYPNMEMVIGSGNADSFNQRKPVGGTRKNDDMLLSMILCKTVQETGCYLNYVKLKQVLSYYGNWDIVVRGTTLSFTNEAGDKSTDFKANENAPILYADEDNIHRAVIMPLSK